MPTKIIEEEYFDEALQQTVHRQVTVEITTAELWREKLGLTEGTADAEILAARDALISARDSVDTQETQLRTQFEARIAALAAAITATEDDLPLPTVANLVQLAALASEVNALRRRQNAILKVLRYFVLRL